MLHKSVKLNHHKYKLNSVTELQVAPLNILDLNGPTNPLMCTLTTRSHTEVIQSFHHQIHSYRTLN
jgi:hypothetical protein